MGQQNVRDIYIEPDRWVLGVNVGVIDKSDLQPHLTGKTENKAKAIQYALYIYVQYIFKWVKIGLRFLIFFLSRSRYGRASHLLSHRTVQYINTM